MNGYDKLLAKEGAGIRPFCIRLIIKDKKFENLNGIKQAQLGKVKFKISSLKFSLYQQPQEVSI